MAASPWNSAVSGRFRPPGTLESPLGAVSFAVMPPAHRSSLSRLATAAAFAAAAIACGGSNPPPAEVRPVPLLTAALAGAPVIVPPVTMVLIESGTPGAAALPAQAELPAWADSLVGEALSLRAPEVHWVLPAELRRVARRAPGIAADPDRMGQAVLRQSSLRVVPDPLRGHLRTLMALAGGGRHALVPAAVLLQPDLSGGVRAHLALVLADGRNGAILWRTEAQGDGPDPAEAVARALAGVLPLQHP